METSIITLTDPEFKFNLPRELILRVAEFLSVPSDLFGWTMVFCLKKSGKDVIVWDEVSKLLSVLKEKKEKFIRKSKKLRGFYITSDEIYEKRIYHMYERNVEDMSLVGKCIDLEVLPEPFGPLLPFTNRFEHVEMGFVRDGNDYLNGKFMIRDTARHITMTGIFDNSIIRQNKVILIQKYQRILILPLNDPSLFGELNEDLLSKLEKERTTTPLKDV